MNCLTIYPSFLCPFACEYCMFKNKLSMNEILDINQLDDIITPTLLSETDKIVISGGDIFSLDRAYVYNLIDKLKSYDKPVILQTYPYDCNIPKGLEYNFSYDFLAKPRATQVWENLLRFDQPFDITITLSPLMFKYHPNALMQKLSLLPKLKSVEFVPYYKNECNGYDITKNNSLKIMTQMILSSKLNLPYKLINKEKINKLIVGESISENELSIFPNGKKYYKSFMDDKISFIETNDEKYSNIISYPENIDMYSNDIINWFKTTII